MLFYILFRAKNKEENQMDGKNIIICCDGTGNEYRAGNNTNVVRLFRVLKKDNKKKQIAFYDPGVGTMAAPGVQLPLAKLITKLLGLAFGYGFSKNVSDVYQFLMEFYEPGDKIFVFGFSRGAYTARAIAGFIKMIGLLEKGSENLIPYAFKLYKDRKRIKPKWAKGVLTPVAYLLYFFWKKEPDWRAAAGFKKMFSRKNVNVHFLGVWDTVKSIGWLRRRIVLPYTFFNNHIEYGRHAVSIDEKRSQYRPNLWGYKNSEKFREVWFAGVHSDIGGSYPERGLSDITLDWMISELKFLTNIEFDNKELSKIPPPNPLGKLHNPLLPIWWILGWWKRTIHKLASRKSKWQEKQYPMIYNFVKIRMEKDKSYKPDIPENAEYVGKIKDEVVNYRSKLSDESLTV